MPYPLNPARPAHSFRQRAASHPCSHPLRRQLGLTLVETMLVITIIIVAAVVGFPVVKGIWIELRVPTVASELQRFMSRTRVLGEGDSVTPYASIDNAKNLAPALQDSTVFKVNGSTVAHRLGGSGTGSSGTITLAPAALGGGALGSAFSITLTNVNAKACPILASTLNGVSETISVNGTAAKTLGANNETGTFNPVTAQDLCTKGDSNTFVFATR
ncbi:type 4 pilus major pilin [Achromobacter sp. 413638]|uniref:type 4 pilus major pilin n=1 Tax=Achromobacter sp. 413638 TaxID=3342385 RepID=UPI00370CB1A0